MKINTIQTIETVLEEHEARIVMHALDYCAGRLKKNKAKWLGSMGYVNKIDKLRTALAEAFNPQI